MGNNTEIGILAVCGGAKTQAILKMKKKKFEINDDSANYVKNIVDSVGSRFSVHLNRFKMGYYNKCY